MKRIAGRGVFLLATTLALSLQGARAQESSYLDECPQSKALIEEAAAQLKGTQKLCYYHADKAYVVARSDAGATPECWFTFQAPVSTQKGAGPDAGHFTLFCGQFLACDGEKISQIRAGGRIVKRDSRELANYNTVIVDGLPPFEAGDPVYRPPSITAFKDYGDYLYVAADLTGPYGRRVKRLTRQIVFLWPNVAVVYDRVNAPEKVSMSWCLNLMENPKVDGNLMKITSRMTANPFYCLTLLPEDSIVVKPRLGENGGGVGACPGFRMERQPRDLVSECSFLHVLYLGVRLSDGEALLPTRLLRTEGHEGVRLEKGGGTTFEFLFANAGGVGGKVTVKKKEGETMQELVVTIEAP